jgi:hypothetical protein
MKKFILLFIACAVSLAQCDFWGKPIIEQILEEKEAEEFDPVEKIMVTKYPFLNTFIRGNEILADLKNGGADLWESECGLEVSGITSGGKMRKLTAEEYTVESFDLDAFNDGSEIPVTVTLNGVLGVTTSFYIAVISLSEKYYEVKIAAGINNGILVPFPLRQKEGGLVTVYAYPNDGYAYMDASVSHIPPPPLDFSYNKDEALIFTMPAGDVTLTVEFFEAAAKLKQDGESPMYYETLEAAFGAVSSGEEAAITLLKDVKIENNITVNGKIKLVAADGPVKTVKRGNADGSLFTVGGAEASLELDAGYSLGFKLDGGWDNNTQTGITGNAPLVEVSGGTLTMNKRVTLQNSVNADSDGGGVAVEDGGTFIMNGGEINNNMSNKSGGGVLVNGGAFTMESGEISGNGADGSGGGVRVNSGGIFTMKSGEISGNKSGDGGGGVLVNGGIFTMEDGEISGNGADGSGGGVYVNGGAFTMEDGEISGNKFGGVGGGVYVNGGAFTMKSGEISGNGAGGSGGGVYVDGEFEMSGSALVKQEVYLSSGKKITVSGLLTPPSGEYAASIRIANTAQTGDIVLDGVGADMGKFQLNNIAVLAHDSAANNYKAYSAVNDAINGAATGTVTIVVYVIANEVPVTGNAAITNKHIKLTALGAAAKTVKRGSGFTGSLFTVSGADASLTLDAGNSLGLTVDGNKDSVSAAAPLVEVSGAGAKLTMGGGVTLKDNNTVNGGGGVRVNSGGMFTMTGGKISGNESGGGGGVLVNGGAFTMEDGEISGNTASHGGGVYVDGEFEISGSALVKQEVYLLSGKTIAVSGPLTPPSGEYAAEIKLADASDSTTVLAGAGSHNLTFADVSKFKLNNIAILAHDSAANNYKAYSAVNDAINGAATGTMTTVVYVVANEVPVTDNAAITNKHIKLTALGAAAKTVKRGSGFTGSLFTVSGADASLTLDAGDSLGLTVDGNKDSVSAAAPLVEVSGGKLTMGKRITLKDTMNTAQSDSGGVWVYSSGTFNMTGGTISGNTAQHNGGGVSVGRSLQGSGTFTMSGGEIRGNTAGGGGGVHVLSDSTFTMTGGEIYHNNTTNGPGGGIFINGGAFTMEGGAIDGNTAADQGGGVFVNGGAFTMEGGAIYGNKATNQGGGVFVNDGAFTMESGYVSANIASLGVGIFVNDNDASFTMSGSALVKQGVYLSSGKKITVSGALKPPPGETYSAEIKLANASDGAVVLEGDGYDLKDEDIKKFTLTLSDSGNIFLLHNNNKGIIANTAGKTGDALYFAGDTPTYAPTLATAISGISAGTTATVYIVQDVITLTGNIPVSGNVTLAALGDGAKTIERGSSSDTLFVIQPGASLTLDAGNGSLTLDGKGISTGSPLVGVSGGTLTMGDGVTLKNNNNTTLQNGGGVMVTNGGKFVMTGGEISVNTLSANSATHGGGVFLDSGGTFTMSGGKISGNTAISESDTAHGGGVMIHGGCVFEMSGGEISGNTASGSNGLGGGVFINYGGTFKMSGGKISGNTASGAGGGVFINGDGVFTMTGGAIYGSGEGPPWSNTAPSGAAVNGKETSITSYP